MNFINGNKFEALADWNKIYYSKIDHVNLFNIPQKPFKFITHNGDLPVHGRDKQAEILNNPNLIAWYGQNVTISHPKLKPIPIGLDRSMPEGIYTDVLNTDYYELERDKLVYFRHWGDSMVKPYRDSVRSALIGGGLIQEPKRGVTEYLTELMQSMFCPCPNGNGVDTHSMWECIYMGCVPIVEENVNTLAFTDLPILLIKDWHQIPILSEHLYKEIRKKSLEKSDFNYWKDEILA